MTMNRFPIEREPRNQTGTETRMAVLRNLEVKKRIVNQVIEGRLPLVEAAARFQAISGHSWSGEIACRTVIGWVALALSERPEQADAVSDRLERELQNFLENSGQLHLSVLN